MIQVEGKKAFHVNLDKNGKINKKFEGYENSEAYVVIIEED